MNERESERLCRIGHGLAAVIGEQVGAAVVYEPDDRLDAILKRARVWDEMDLIDFFTYIWDSFGLPWQREEQDSILPPADTVDAWERFASREWTMRRIAERIRDRLDRVQVKDAFILGRACRPAGAFLAVEGIWQELFHDQARFKPSDPIQAHLWGGRLRLMWRRLRWVSNLDLPQLRESGVTTAERIVTWASTLIIAGIVLYWLGADDFPRRVSSSAAWNWGFALGPLGVACLVLWPAKHLLQRIDRRLPEAIETFRDLSVLLARSRRD